MTKDSKLKVVNNHLNYDKVTLKTPLTSKYIHIAAEIDKKRIPVFLTTSSRKKNLIRACKAWCSELEKMEGVIDISLFQATIIPPGMGRFVQENLDKIHLARFDFVILIEAESDQIGEAIKSSEVYKTMLNQITEVASHTSVVSATNVRRIGSVDHKKQGVFLFNYFAARDTDQNLEVWEYTAGWFQKETGLDNSTLLIPEEKENTTYSIINHCRWDGYQDILPSLVFKSTFRTYVLDNFFANHVGPQAILYKLIK